MKTTPKFFFTAVISLVLFAGCGKEEKPLSLCVNGENCLTATPLTQQSQQQIPPSVKKPDSSQQQVHIPNSKDNQKNNNQTDPASTAQQVMETLKNKEFKKLSSFIHPQKGLRFEPYLQQFFEGPTFSMKEFIEAYSTPAKKYVWGSYDGSGADIKLSFAEYYRRFIYNKDFIKIKPRLYSPNSQEIEQAGTALWDPNTNDLVKNYPDAKVFYYSYPDPDYGEGNANWAALALVLEKEKNQWYLVAIIHNEWQI